MVECVLTVDDDPVKLAAGEVITWGTPQSAARIRDFAPPRKPDRIEARHAPANDVDAGQLCASSQGGRTYYLRSAMAIAGSVVLKFRNDEGDMRPFVDIDADVIRF